MANKVGPLIKEARTKAGLTQEQLAKKIKGVEASDISKAERGEYVPTQAVLKEIAKITGVTQASLIEAAKQSTAASKSSTSSSKSNSSSKSTSSSKTSTSSKTGSSSSKTGSSSSKTGSSSSKTGSTSSKTGSSSSKTGSSSTSSTTSMKVTSAEKRLIELYRKASTDDKKAVVKILKGEDDGPGDLFSAILDTAANLLGNKK